MRRGWAVATIAMVVLGVVLAAGAIWDRARRRPSDLTSSPGQADRPTSEAALARLQRIPFYRSLLRGRVLRSASLDRDGTLSVDVDLRAIVEPRLAAVGLAGASDLLPVSARGTIVSGGSAGQTGSADLRETWIFDGPAPVLDLLDRSPSGKGASTALDAIPGEPSALARARLMPSRLTDSSLGGAALAAWRDRVGFAEKLLGRPLRAELAEDLAGPAVFALYETADPTAAEAIVAVELRRSDRLAALCDMVFGLGALAERAEVRRYRGVATGSFVSQSGGLGVALAVDGPVFLIATSRAFLESAIDARRAAPHRGAVAVEDRDASASWSAVSRSTFVSHGWGRLARLPDAPTPPRAATSAALWPVGASSWRLDGHGAAPAITADPMLPFFRSAFATRQGAGD